MLASSDMLGRLSGTELPGGEIVIEAYENAILECALRAPDLGHSAAHPMWFIVISLRCLGISVDELCEMAHKTERDTLLFGNCVVDQQLPLEVGARYRIRAVIATVGTRSTRGGNRLDNIDVRVDIVGESEILIGSVTSSYLFKRGDDQ